MKKRTVTLDSGEVELDIVRSSRRTVALYVRPGGTLLIRAPWYVPVNLLLQFVHRKTSWIEQQIIRLKDAKPVGEALPITDKGIVPFMGKELTVKVIDGSHRSAAATDGQLILTVNREATPEYLSEMTEAWYLREAKAYMRLRTAELAAMHSGKLPAPSAVNVRKMKRRWGSCNSNGTILLNRELIKKDPALIDYVIIHELCHLVHHNHSGEYYALLESILPEFRELRAKIRTQ